MEKVYILMRHEINRASSDVVMVAEDKETLYQTFKQHWHDEYSLSDESEVIIDGVCDLFERYDYFGDNICEEDCWWIEECEIMELSKKSSPIVSEILFDVTYQGEKYKDLDLGYHDDEDVTYDCIHYEDGPWGMVQVGENVMDFQIYGDEENELQMQACMMIPSSQIINDEVELCWGHGDFIDDIEVSNIRVKYTEPVCHIKPKK